MQLHQPPRDDGKTPRNKYILFPCTTAPLFSRPAGTFEFPKCGNLKGQLRDYEAPSLNYHSLKQPENMPFAPKRHFNLSSSKHPFSGANLVLVSVRVGHFFLGSCFKGKSGSPAGSPLVKHENIGSDITKPTIFLPPLKKNGPR